MRTTRSFPISRSYKADDNRRNCSIAVFDDGNEEWGKYRISVSFEGWTGAVWLPIHQEAEAYTAEDAFAKARDIRDQFGWVA